MNQRTITIKDFNGDPVQMPLYQLLLWRQGLGRKGVTAQVRRVLNAPHATLAEIARHIQEAK